jgi:NADH dehydrogenase
VEPALHRIVVVGGGAGGLELATRLGNKLGRRGKAHITLIDKARTHLWKPLLHEIAAGSMDEDMHAIDYLAQAYWHGFVYRSGAMAGIDRARRLVQVAPFVDEEGRQVTPAQEVGYDTLVIAIGSLTNDFGTPGVKEHAIALETADEAVRFHARLVNACIRAHVQKEPLRPEQLQVAIIGAGATGTELAAELHKTTRQLVAFGLDRIDPDMDIKINLIEAAPRILPQLPERLAKGGSWAARRAQGARAYGSAGGGGAGQRRQARRRRAHPGRAGGMGGRREGAGRAGRHCRARDQPAQPARGAWHAADHARRRHLRHR